MRLVDLAGLLAGADSTTHLVLDPRCFCSDVPFARLDRTKGQIHFQLRDVAHRIVESLGKFCVNLTRINSEQSVPLKFSSAGLPPIREATIGARGRRCAGAKLTNIDVASSPRNKSKAISANIGSHECVKALGGYGGEGRHYDEKALAAIVIEIALINVWNRVNVTTRQVASAAGVGEDRRSSRWQGGRRCASLGVGTGMR